MNKSELIDVIASKTNVTKKEADTILTAMTQTIVEVVSGGDKVSLVGFGSFEPRQRQALLRSQSQIWREDDDPCNSYPCLLRWQVVQRESCSH